MLARHYTTGGTRPPFFPLRWIRSIGRNIALWQNLWVGRGVGRFERRSSSARASLALCGRFNQFRSPYSWITMRRALRKRRVFDFVPSYLKKSSPSLFSSSVPPPENGSPLILVGFAVFNRRVMRLSSRGECERARAPASLVDFEGSFFFFFFCILGKSYAGGRRETKKIITLALCGKRNKFELTKNREISKIERIRQKSYDVHERLYKRYGGTTKPADEATNARLTCVSIVDRVIFLRTKRKNVVWGNIWQL